MTISNPIPGTYAAPQRLLAALIFAGMLAGCEPTVKVEAPQEPITINLNIKLDADVRVKIEEEAQETIAANPDIF